jgi:hypothetical protein
MQSTLFMAYLTTLLAAADYSLRYRIIVIIIIVVVVVRTTASVV